MPRQRRPVPVQQLSIGHGLITWSVTVMASVCAVMLGDIGWRSCKGFISGSSCSSKCGESDDFCWAQKWRWLIPFLRISMLSVSGGFLVAPEFLLRHTTLVSKLIPGDAWNRIKSRMAVAWFVLYMAYLKTLESRPDARERYLLTEAMLETCQSPIGFMALASVVSYFSRFYRVAVYTSVLRTGVFPEKLFNDGNGTWLRIGFYVLLLRVTGYWTPSLFFPIACLTITELDFCEAFRRILRPIIADTQSYDITDDKFRAVVATIMIYLMSTVMYKTIIWSSYSPAMALLCTLPAWLLIPWFARSLSEMGFYANRNKTRNWIWVSDAELLMVAPAFGHIVQCGVALLVYGFLLIQLDSDDRILFTILLSTLFVSLVMNTVNVVYTAYQKLIPRRILYWFIYNTMRKPDANSPQVLTDFCAICYGDNANLDDMRLTPCNHLYHISCLSLWLFNSNTCPTCRGLVANPISMTNPIYFF